MSKQQINLGTADKGNGDPLRVAFAKVNDNFSELYNQLAASVVVGATAPTAPEEGSLWWNSESGRMYVYYGTAWVDASPVDGAGISSTNELVNGNKTVSLGTDGGLTFPSGILADLGGAEFGTGFSLTTDGDQAIIGASNLISLETSGGYGQLHLTQDTETDKGRVEIFFQNGPGVLWIFDEEDSSLTFPDTTKQTTAWTGITGFGEGFGLTDADKIVTNKLYSTNLTQPTQHYRLELDTNGVVRLPDGSIINGSTIRGIAGTGELNYTGITIGPNSNDAEKTWMWVDHANAYISTNNAANTWTFGTEGKLTLPGNSYIDDDSDIFKILNNTSSYVTGLFMNSDQGQTDLAVNTVGGEQRHWIFDKDGSTTFPGELHGPQVIEESPGGPMPVGNTLKITPASELGVNSKSFAFRIDHAFGLFNQAYLEMPEAETNKTVGLSFAHDNGTVGYIFNQGTNPSDNGFNNAVNILANGTNIKLTAEDVGGGLSTWTFGTDGALTFPDGATTTGKSITVPVNQSLTVNLPYEGGFETGTTTFKINTESIKLPTGNGYIYSGSEINANKWGLDSGNKELTFPNGDSIHYDQSGTGLQLYTFANPIKITSAQTKTWEFGADGELALPTNGYTEAVIKELDATALVLFAQKAGANVKILAGATSAAGAKQWLFNGTNGNLTLPASGDVVDSTSVSQLAKRVEGSWTVTTGTNTYSFTVPMDGTYTMWVKGNIPNGIITWNATLSISNTNVPAIGTQYAWNYTGGGSPILLTTIPDQIRGSAGTISTDATYAGTTSNRFDFGISNTSGSSQTIYYGYIKI